MRAEASTFRSAAFTDGLPIESAAERPLEIHAPAIWHALLFAEDESNNGALLRL